LIHERGVMDTLYDAIGGLPALEVAVQRFCERVRTDMAVAEFFVWMDLHHQKSQLIGCLRQVVGGPTHQARATMRRKHAILPVRQRQFEVVVDHLVAALQELGIADALVAAVMERTWPVAVQIVNSGSVRAAAA
jgi:hemoglobin